MVRKDNGGLVAPEITSPIIACALEVHRQLGPGLLESAYSDGLAREFFLKSIPFERQKAFSTIYKGHIIGCAFRADFVVDRQVIVELKAVRKLEDVHFAQVNTYLKVSGCRIGLLINFNVRLLRHGLHRLIRPDARSDDSGRRSVTSVEK